MYETKGSIDLSLIIPVYNVEQYLEECLQSVYAINDINFEVILINDGSTDNSISVINQFNEKYRDKTLIIEQLNQGQSAARNAGIKNAKGKYITFVDSDDRIDPVQIAFIVNNALENDLDLVQVRGVKFDHEVDVELPFPNEMYDLPISNGRDYLMAYCNVASVKNRNFRPEVWLLFIKNTVVIANDIQFVENMHYEDELMVPKIILYCKRVKALNSLSYYYRTTPNSIMTTFTPFHLQSKAKLVNEYYKMIKENNFNHEFLNSRMIGWCAESIEYISFKLLFKILLIKNVKLKDLAFLTKLILQKLLSFKGKN